jgi:hypothetical protein
MKYFRLYHKQNESGDETMNHLYNLVGEEHPLAQARRNLRRHLPEGTIPEFKKLGENRWRLNGVHRHPLFMASPGVWYVEYSHDEGA